MSALALAASISLSQALPAQALDPDRVFGAGIRGLSALRLLEDRSMELEYPASGHFGMIGTQLANVKIRPPGEANDLDATLSRTSIEAGWGWENFKFGFFLDGLALGQDVDFFLGGLRSGGAASAGDRALGLNIVAVGSYTHDPYNSILAGINASQTTLLARATPEESSSITPLVRARLCGYTGELGFPQQNDSFSLGSFLSSIDPLGVLYCFGDRKETKKGDDGELRTGSLPVDLLLRLNPTVDYYGEGSNPFILDLAHPNLSEIQGGVSWSSLPEWPLRVTARATFAVNGDSGFRIGEVGLDYNLRALPFRIVGQLSSPHYLYNLLPVYPVTFLGGIGSPGATYLGLNARAFVVRLDDGMHFGFSAGIRAEVFTNNKRRSPDDDAWQAMLRDWEGEDYEYVRAYLEFRASMNDMFSPAGVPLADHPAFGFFYVIEIFSNAPRGNDRGRYQTRYLNAGLDGNVRY